MTNPTTPADGLLRDALKSILDRYVSLVECVDCGHWNPELEAEVINARSALNAGNESAAQQAPCYSEVESSQISNLTVERATSVSATPADTGEDQGQDEDTPRVPTQPAVFAPTDDLAMMLRRLTVALAHSNARHPIIDQAKDLLKRFGLEGSPLR